MGTPTEILTTAVRAGPVTATETSFAEVLAGVLDVAHVPVDSHFFDDLGADSMVMARFCARVRKHPDLPPVSMKDIYRHPTIGDLAAAFTVEAPVPPPVPPWEKGFAEVLAGVLDVAHVPVDSHFFDDLGADSMVMARFCARVRKHPDLPPVSMKDIYRHPRIRSLATAFPKAAPPAVESSAPPTVELPVQLPVGQPVQLPVGQPVELSAELPVAALPTAEAAEPASTSSYVLCGALQLLFFLGYVSLTAAVGAHGYAWISDGSGLVDVYLRSVLFGGVLFAVLSTLPILAKWVLVGRWTPREIPVWSLHYVRFWIVRTLVRVNPLALFFAGSPLYVFYLRALGARIGPGAAIFSRQVPVCTDLLTIGAGTVVRKEALLLCYRARAGRIQTGPVTLGRDVVVGEKTVLDIWTTMGDGAQLGHASALHCGAAVPDGERWHGSPAQRTEVDYLRVEPARCGVLRRAGYVVVTLLQVLLVVLPLVQGGVALVLAEVPSLARLGEAGIAAVDSPLFYLEAITLSAVLYFGGLLLGLLVAFSVPRLLHRLLTPGKVYPLYGFHYGVQRTIARMTNLKVFTQLLGDSSYIVHYLKGLGYDLSRVEQTGSNFGTQVMHESPYLSSVGSGTMVADGLSFMNAEFSSTSFRVSPVSIGAHSFLGNNIAYPPQGRTGENVLLATKVMVPLDGPVREGVGLLGSPAFEIPRSVERDGRFDDRRTAEELPRHLAAKNRHNLRSMGVFLFARWVNTLLLTLLAMAAVDVHGAFADVALAAFLALGILLSAGYAVLCERLVARFRPLRPRYCSIYDPYFWWHERLWKLTAMTYLRLFDGTPFKTLVWRALGVRIGRQVFDDGCAMTERTLTTVGDHCTLNLGSTIQCHSQEDGAFKSDRTTLGAGCTLGVGAFVHYGVTMGAGSVLAADSFLMKGEEVPPSASWGGNPAGEISAEHHPPPTATATARDAATRRRRRPPQHARHDVPEVDLEGQAEIAARLDDLDAAIRALRRDGDRVRDVVARQEEALAEITPSLRRLTAERQTIRELIRGGTTREDR